MRGEGGEVVLVVSALSLRTCGRSVCRRQVFGLQETHASRGCRRGAAADCRTGGDLAAWRWGVTYIRDPSDVDLSRLEGLFEGMLEPDEAEAFQLAVEAGTHCRCYEGVGGLLGLAKVRSRAWRDRYVMAGGGA